MTRFRYLRDRLFLISCSCYALNRWLVKPRVHNSFVRGHFNDLLLIPCALPPLLLIQRWIRLRQQDGPPGFGEIVFVLGIWSVLFEVIGPRLFPWATGDAWDVIAYLAGGMAAALWWNRQRWVRSMASDGL